jgi:hypothetical protein
MHTNFFTGTSRKDTILDIKIGLYIWKFGVSENWETTLQYSELTQSSDFESTARNFQIIKQQRTSKDRHA